MRIVLLRATNRGYRFARLSASAARRMSDAVYINRY